MNLLRLLGAAHAAGMRPAARRFQAALQAPGEAQQAALRRYLAEARGTAFGEEHGLDRVHDLAALREAVPLRRGDGFRPWLLRVEGGEDGVMTQSPVRMVEETGGTHGTKRIPYTSGLLAEFSAATSPWLYGLWRHHRGVRGTRSYWAVSPATRPAGARTAGGVPIGFEDDTQYFGRLERFALSRMVAVPASVARIGDIEVWRDTTAQHLVAAADLGLISVWSPSYLIPIMQYIEAELDRLLPPERRRDVHARLAAGHGLGEALWPRLSLISCWADGPSSDPAIWQRLRRWFPRTTVQPKGLLATEGVVSIPLIGQAGSALAVTSHLLEFVDMDDATPGDSLDGRDVLAAHELVPGGRYSPALTTSGGLCRYAMGDIVRCVGRLARTPLIRFEGRMDDVCDLRGEKVSAEQAAAAIAAARVHVDDRFAMIAPLRGEPARYGLFVDSDAADDHLHAAARAADEALAAAHPYAHARRLGQLAPMQPLRIRDGWAAYEAGRVQAGARAGSVKPTALHAGFEWEELLGGERV